MLNKSIGLRIAVFASGRGSNFKALQESLVAMPDPPATITLCVSNNPSPGAFNFAHEQGIETLRISPRMFDDTDAYASALLALLRDHGIGLIVLAGYMKRIPPVVVDAYKGRILNVHPSLLPKYGGQGMYGMNVHAAIIEAGESESGATVHLIDNEYDTGPVVAQERIAIRENETAESLAARVLDVEHRLLTRVVVAWAEQVATNHDPVNDLFP